MDVFRYPYIDRVLELENVMEHGRSYWVVLRNNTWASHPHDRGYERYDDEQFWFTEEACQLEVSRLNGSQIDRQEKELQKARSEWELAKADWDALVAMGRREGGFREFKAPHRPSPEFKVGKITWHEIREGDKITMETY